LIFVDSSVWINFFSPFPGRAGKELHRMIADAEPFAIAGVVVAEILQGLTRDVGQIERYLSMWDILEPVGFSTYRKAAAIFRLARFKGISLSTIDTLLAAIVMHQRMTRLGSRRDKSTTNCRQNIFRCSHFVHARPCHSHFRIRVFNLATGSAASRSLAAPRSPASHWQRSAGSTG
jgi:predicted nucleic acid-binding protein